VLVLGLCVSVRVGTRIRVRVRVRDGYSASASLNEAPNYSNWPSIFCRLFKVATLLNNDRLLVVTVHQVHLYWPAFT